MVFTLSKLGRLLGVRCLGTALVPKRRQVGALQGGACAFCAFLWQHFLVAYLERELNHSWPGTRRCNTSKRGRHGDVAVWIGEVGPVKEIEELCTQFRPHRFFNR